MGSGIVINWDDALIEPHYFLLLEAHTEIIRKFKTNLYYTDKKNIYEKNCSIYLYKNKCYGLNYVNNVFLIPFEKIEPEI